MAIGGFSGVASGIDTDSIVKQLIALDRQPAQRMEVGRQRAQARQSQLADVATRLRGLKSAAADLRSVALWSNVQDVSSSDPTRVAVTRTATAAAGTHQVTVSSLAVADQHAYDYQPSVVPSQLSINGTAISVGSNASLQSVVDTINGRADLAASASIANGQLVLKAKTTGTDAALTVASSPSNLGVFTEDASRRVAAANAQYTVDGVAGSSQTNTITGAIAGLDLNAYAPTVGTVTITVGDEHLDTDKIKAKVKAFVDKYNDTMTFVRGKLTEKRVTNPTTATEAGKGLLAGDTVLSGLVGTMRAAMIETVAANPALRDEMREIGVSTGATTGAATFSRDAVEGKLLLDDAVLSQALSSDPVSVQRLLGGLTGQAGFAQRFEGIVDTVAQAGGVLDQRGDAAGAEARRFSDRVTDLDKRLALKEVRLRKQFTAMESALQASQAQMARLQGQLGSLTR